MGQPWKQMDKTTWILVGLITWRIINASSIKTFFQPDEYFQSLEPAWQVAFGSESGAWITWEWKEQLRSSFHPLIFAMAYKVADWCSKTLSSSPSTHAGILIAAPKILQAVIAAAGDFYSWRLARRLHGDNSNASWAALALTIWSPWQWFCSTRTFSNSFETTLTALALSYWPWEWVDNETSDWNGKATRTKIQKSNLTIALFASAVASILRPTNLIIWIVIGTLTIARARDWDKTSKLIEQAAFCGGSVLMLTIAIDWAYFGEPTIPAFKFLYFNVVQSLAVFYGSNRPDYYVTEGLPLLLTTALPFAILGLWQSLRFDSARKNLANRAAHSMLALAVMTMITILSIIGHKEVRFIYPLLPILHVLASRPLSNFLLGRSHAKHIVILLLLSMNIIIAGYTTLIHQRGVIDVLTFIRQVQENRLLDTVFPATSNITVGFLMPCHSTPWRSHFIHPQIHAWALTCEPPLHISQAERQDYLDEADVFYQNATLWVQKNMLLRKPELNASTRPLPEYLVFFEQLQPELKRVLAETSYTQRWRGFNTHWHDDWRRFGDVIVWQLVKS